MANFRQYVFPGKMNGGEPSANITRVDRHTQFVQQGSAEQLRVQETLTARGLQNPGGFRPVTGLRHKAFYQYHQSASLLPQAPEHKKSHPAFAGWLHYFSAVAPVLYSASNAYRGLTFTLAAPSPGALKVSSLSGTPQ